MATRPSAPGRSSAGPTYRSRSAWWDGTSSGRGLWRPTSPLSSGTRGETILSAPAELTVSGTPPDAAEGGELAWTILVADDPDRCDVTHPDRFNEQTVVVTTSDALTGAIPAYAAGEGPSASFTINCPDSAGPASSAASMGAALVPENPFPVDR